MNKLSFFSPTLCWGLSERNRLSSEMFLKTKQNKHVSA